MGLISRVSSRTYRLVIPTSKMGSLYGINEIPIGDYTQDDALSVLKESRNLIPEQVQSQLDNIFNIKPVSSTPSSSTVNSTLSATNSLSLSALRVRKAFDVFTAKPVTMKRQYTQHQAGGILKNNININTVDGARQAIISDHKDKIIESDEPEPIPKIPEE